MTYLRGFLLLLVPLWLAPAPAPEAVAQAPTEGLVARRAGSEESLPLTGWSWDTRSTEVHLDVASLRGRAVLALAPPRHGVSPPATVTLSVGTLQVDSVEGPGGPLPFRVSRGERAGPYPAGNRLDIFLPADLSVSPQRPLTVEIAYRFLVHRRFDGFLTSGVTFLWPYYCGNLFPCDPDPGDGLAFDLSVTGLGPGETVVTPDRVSEAAPPYMPAFAVGEYGYRRLGVTEAGTEVGLWTLPGSLQRALAGTADLTAVFDWYERTYGPYAFGPSVASVVVDWEGGGLGGMEHHPYWHISRTSSGDAVTHAHEAAHGWFGNGVRLRCWEDFVLSEGVATYLAARALEAVKGTSAGRAVWRRYREQLLLEVERRDTVAWPRGCNRIDILQHPLWSLIPYLKGAFFLREVEEAVGRPALDAALRHFYQRRVGHAAGMSELLATIRSETGFDPRRLVERWLRSRGLPPP